MMQKTFHTQTAAFISRIMTCLPSDLSTAEMQRCIDDPKGLQLAIDSWLRPQYVFKDKKRILICPEQVLATLVKLGGYSTVTPHLSFLTNLSSLYGEYEYKLIRFEDKVLRNQLLEILNNAGFAPAELVHLLIYGIMFPEAKNVIALGSTANITGVDISPCIYMDLKHDRRELNAWMSSHSEDLKINPDREFLVVKKVS